jgi:hypothetical protein
MISKDSEAYLFHNRRYRFYLVSNKYRESIILVGASTL